MKIRSFIAADLTTEIKNKIKEVQRESISRGISASWVNPESIHLTLAFLGAIEQTVIDELIPSLEAVSRGIGQIKCQVIGLGVFPSDRRPRVIWLGLNEIMPQGQEPKLQKLQSGIADKVTRHGIVLEKRPFKPHLTIARVRKHQPQNARLIAEQLSKYKDKVFGDFEINEFYLYRSDLRKTGAIYTKLKKFDLMGC